MELFAFAPGVLAGQGGWLLTTDPTLLVESPGHIITGGVEFDYRSNDFELEAGIPFDEPWEMSADVFFPSGVGYSYIALQIRVGIIQINGTWQCDGGGTLDYGLWGGTIAGSTTITVNQVHRIALRYASGVGSFVLDGVVIATAAQTPGSDVPDFFRLAGEGTNPFYISRVGYGPP